MLNRRAARTQRDCTRTARSLRAPILFAIPSTFDLHGPPPRRGRGIARPSPRASASRAIRPRRKAGARPP